MCDSFSEAESDENNNIKRKVLKQLQSIRSSILKKDKDSRELNHKDFILNIVRFLNIRDDNIMRESLNLLFYCCKFYTINQEIVEEILPTVTVLLHRGKNNKDYFNYKCCKLLEIIAKKSAWSDKLHEYRTTELIVTLLHAENSEKIKMSALRILRLLWVSSNQNDRNLMLQSNFIDRLKICISSDNDTILSEALCLITSLVKFKNSNALSQLFTSGIGVLLSRRMDLFKVQALVYNFSLIQEIKPNCGTANFIEAILDQLNKNTENTDKISILLLSLYRFTNDATCRLRLRAYDGSVSTLFRFVDCKIHPINTQYVISIFANFLFDEYMTKMLAQDKFLSIFLNCLKHINSICVSEHEDGNDKTVNYLLPCSSQFYDDGFKEKMSASRKVYDVMKNKNVPELSIYIGLDKLILQVVKKLIFSDMAVMEFTSLFTWNIILDYMSLVGQYADLAALLLRSIVGNNKYILMLIKNKIPLLVHKTLFRTDHVNCATCGLRADYARGILNEFCSISLSSYVTQIFNNELNDLREGNRLFISCIIANIFVTRPALNHILPRYPIIDNIFEALTVDELFDEAIAGLCSMAGAFTEDHRRTRGPIKENIVFHECEHPLNVERPAQEDTFANTISFRLDDDSVIVLDKTRLSTGSPVFEAMFNDDFREKHQSEIRLRDITYASLELLHHSVGSRFCRCPTYVPLSVLLETILQADRFLIQGLQLWYILNYYAISYDNCCEIYDWSYRKLLFDNSLGERIRCRIVEYLLGACLGFQNRKDAIGRLLKTSYATDVLKTAKTIITRNIESDKCELSNERPFNIDFLKLPGY